MRYTKTIATIGPATNSVEAIEELAKSGVSICRMNFSHGDDGFHSRTIRNVRAVNKKGYCLGILLDTKGPEVRTGDVKEPLTIKRGDLVAFVAHKPTGRETLKTVQVDYDSFARDAAHARTIYIDNGAIEMRLHKVEKGVVIARALEGGKIGSRRHVNLPGAYISLPSFTAKDWKDITFGINHDVDFFAISFVRTGKDVAKLRAFLKKRRSSAHIIAKIETPQAVTNIDDIIASSDGIMIARGDLGSEVPFEDVPKIQDEIVRKCREAARPVIVATHMLESMILSPTPTRAEVTDIAYAARLQADSTMLSGETANGMYPFKAAKAMDKVLRRNERIEPTFKLMLDHVKSGNAFIDVPRKEQALAACVLATKLNADALLVMSKHGRTAAAVSNCRPLVPIHAFTDSESCQRRMTLLWGIIPHRIRFFDNTELTVTSAIDNLKAKKMLNVGSRVVVVSDLVTKAKRIMTIQMRTIT